MLAKNSARTLSAILLAATACASELKPATVEAWNKYVSDSVAHAQPRPQIGRSFLRIDGSPSERTRLRKGEVVVIPGTHGGNLSVPDGLIHDWIGDVFIPEASIRDLRTVLDDYDAYKQIYKPVVTDSRTLSSDAIGQEFSMVWKRHILFITAAMRARYRAHEVIIDGQHGYSIVDAIQIQQIENYGGRNQRVLGPDTGGGFIWRLRSIVKYAERDGGVYLEIQAIALTRAIPSSLEWLIGPVVRRLSIDSLTATLRQTREAVDTCVRSDK
jgi:hypothetical protein